MGKRTEKNFYRHIASLRLGVAFLVLALFLLAYAAPRREWNGLLATLLRAQLSPALIRGGVLSLAAIAVLATTFAFGRLYCSAVCPLGTLQEIFWRGGTFFRRGAHRASVLSPEDPRGRTRNARPYVNPWKIRYLVPVLVGVGIAFGVPPLIVGMDPVSIFGRGVRGIAGLLREPSSLAPFAAASLAVFAAVLLLSLWRGRRFCDWCPVGVALGFCASVAPLGMRMDADGCVACGACERSCPMNCVDVDNKKLSRERCVLCLRCASVCPTGAARYGRAPQNAALPEERRQFLAGGGRLALGAAASYFGIGSLRILRSPSEVEGRLRAETAFAERIEGPILPPGAGDIARYTSRCVSCQACVAACPVKIVKLKATPHPVLDYTNGYCQFSCTDCAQVCPTEAIRLLRREEKQRTRIALSSLRIERCVVVEKKQACGACAEVCPTHAVRMQSYAEAKGLPQPVFEEEYCIGCGACRFACPVTDEPRAFEIAAVPRQTTTPGIRPADKAEDLALPGMGEEFPF